MHVASYANAFTQCSLIRMSHRGKVKNVFAKNKTEHYVHVETSYKALNAADYLVMMFLFLLLLIEWCLV